jgi:hypothetical protein
MSVEGEIRLNHPVEFMRFTLVYDGQLPAQTTHDSRVFEKHAIRKQLHGQLADIWNHHPALEGLLNVWKASPKSQIPPEESIELVKQFNRGIFHFIPLATKAAQMICELDILFLRREPKGYLVNAGGDIDNRIKVLFDSLRILKEENELPANAAPSEGEDPFFCLLEDDSLITAVRVESERLADSNTLHNANHVRLVLRVTIKVQRLRYDTLAIGGD